MTVMTAAVPANTSDKGAPGGRKPRRFSRHFGFRNIGAIYVWIALIVVFSLWIPGLWLRPVTATSILNDYAVTAIVAMGLVVSLAAGVIDLSFASTISLGGVVAGALLSATDLPVIVCLVAAVASGMLVGLVNAFAIIKLKLDSLLATLGTGAIVAAAAIGVSGDRILTDRMAGELNSVASTRIFGIEIAVFYAIILTIILAIFLEHTVGGRKVYATGYNAEAARLMGISVGRVRTGALVITGGFAAFGGVILAARITAASPDGGAHYLIPVFSAVFLGATQFRSGRFNTWGTLVAVLVIGTGSLGLILAGVPRWAPNVFSGLILIAAVAITVADWKPLRTKKSAEKDGTKA